MFVSKHRGMILLVMSLTLLHTRIVLVNADYVVTVRGTSYTNQEGRCASCTQPETTVPSCCDSPDCSGTDLCDTRFLYCLRSVSPPMEFAGQSYCSPVNPGIFTPSISMDSNTVDFNRDMVLGLSNPLNLTGISRQYMGVTLYIWVMDQDDGSVDTIDEFFIDITSPLNITIPNRQYLGYHSVAQMGLSYTVTCARYYYGTFCENLNACELNTVNCSGRGQCIDGEEGNSFSCECESGYTGEICENVDYCSNNEVDCQGNGVCVNTQNSDNPTVCLCNEGFSGATCGQRKGAVSLPVIIAASVGGGLVLFLATILGVILIYVCYRNAPRPQPKKANIAQTQRRGPRSRPTSQAGLYSQFRWSRFDPTQAPPVTTPSAYQHSVNMNQEASGYDPAPQIFTSKAPPSSNAPVTDGAGKMEIEKKIDEETEDETSTSEESEQEGGTEEQPGRTDI